jgi:transcriptional antiterminator
MILFRQIELLKLAHKLINMSNTGSPQEFAKQLGISTRRLHEIIDEMKDLDAPIAYSRSAETYYYKEDYNMQITCTFQRLSNKEQKDISGGRYLFSHFFFTAFFVQ